MLYREITSNTRLSVVVYGTAQQNGSFSMPVSIIRNAAGLGPPLPGQPGPFSLGTGGALAAELAKAGFSDVEVREIDAPLSGLPERRSTWTRRPRSPLARAAMSPVLR